MSTKMINSELPNVETKFREIVNFPVPQDAKGYVVPLTNVTVSTRSVGLYIHQLGNNERTIESIAELLIRSDSISLLKHCLLSVRLFQDAFTSSSLKGIREIKKGHVFGNQLSVFRDAKRAVANVNQQTNKKASVTQQNVTSETITDALVRPFTQLGTLVPYVGSFYPVYEIQTHPTRQDLSTAIKISQLTDILELWYKSTAFSRISATSINGFFALLEPLFQDLYEEIDRWESQQDDFESVFDILNMSLTSQFHAFQLPERIAKRPELRALKSNYTFVSAALSQPVTQVFTDTDYLLAATSIEMVCLQLANLRSYKTISIEAYVRNFSLDKIDAIDDLLVKGVAIVKSHEFVAETQVLSTIKQATTPPTYKLSLKQTTTVKLHDLATTFNGAFNADRLIALNRIILNLGVPDNFALLAGGIETQDLHLIAIAYSDHVTLVPFAASDVSDEESEFMNMIYQRMRDAGVQHSFLENLAFLHNTPVADETVYYRSLKDTLAEAIEKKYEKLATSGVKTTTLTVLRQAPYLLRFNFKSKNKHTTMNFNNLAHHYQTYSPLVVLLHCITGEVPATASDFSRQTIFTPAMLQRFLIDKPASILMMSAPLQQPVNLTLTYKSLTVALHPTLLTDYFRVNPSAAYESLISLNNFQAVQTVVDTCLKMWKNLTGQQQPGPVFTTDPSDVLLLKKRIAVQLNEVLAAFYTKPEGKSFQTYLLRNFLTAMDGITLTSIEQQHLNSFYTNEIVYMNFAWWSALIVLLRIGYITPTQFSEIETVFRDLNYAQELIGTPYALTLTELLQTQSSD